MPQYYVYIVFSPGLGKFYVGMSMFTAKRFRQHKKGQSHWTSTVDDWIEVWKTGVENSPGARELGKKIKKEALINGDIASLTLVPSYFLRQFRRT